MTDLVTIIGLCCVDDTFRHELADPNGKPRALRHFLLLKEECARLPELRAALVECEAQFQAINAALSTKACGSECCQDPPCD